MDFLRAATLVRLRTAAGRSNDVLGEIEQGTVAYVVGQEVSADSLRWANIAAVLKDGSFRVGWAATSVDDTPLLNRYIPTTLYSAPFNERTIVTQFFGENPGVYAKFGYRGHNGLDFGVMVGTPLVSLSDGVVEHATNDPTGYGNYLRIRHRDGAIAVYAHLNDFSVSVGEAVSERQVIGRTGNSGMSTGPHLHLDLRPVAADGNNGFGGRIDPLPLLVRHKFIWPAYVPVQLKGVL